MESCPSEQPRRYRLPNRRLLISDVIEWQNLEWVVSAGFDKAGRAREMFANGFKPGSAMDAIMDDACVMMSLLLQGDYSAADLERHLGREGADPTAPAASPLGLITQVVAAFERENGAAISEFYSTVEEARA